MFVYYFTHGVFYLSLLVCGETGEITSNMIAIILLTVSAVLNSFLLHNVRHRPGYIAKDQLAFREIKQMPQILENFPSGLETRASTGEEICLTDRGATRVKFDQELHHIPKDQLYSASV